MAPATSEALTKKYSGPMTAAARASAAALPGCLPRTNASGTPATQTVNVSDAMLKTIRCSGLRGPRRNVHWAHALTAAMHTVGADPSANSAQKFTAWDNDRFDWLRPSGSSIFALDVATASSSSVVNSHGWSN